ncbi:MAG: hypothetical protein IKD94_03095 [Erysipelotrichaceae bacterium]|nr:hypothetical protein [Erysipelotrichaceae bacterium]
MDKLLNVTIIILEIIGLIITYRQTGWKMFIYYTILSNCLALIASIFYLMNYPMTSVLRYTATCMLVMTLVITLFVLSPAVGSVKLLMVDGNGLYHHTLCPILSLISYVFFEKHSNMWTLPVIASLLYGLMMIWLNYINKMIGPYHFFEIRKQGIKKTALWVVALILIISSISLGVSAIAG